MSKTTLIDVNAIGHAANAASKLTTNGMETQAVFGVIKTMRALRMKYPQHTPMVLWDGKAEWRFKLHPEYKSNRKSDPKKAASRESYGKQKPYIQKALAALGVRQLTSIHQEADDLGGYFVKKLSADPANDIVLVTGDKDWLQLVRSNVSWVDLRDDSKRINANNFYEKTGCLSPFAFLETKILTGDNSDVISGVGGIGEKGAPEFIAEFGSVRNFWQLCDSGAFVPKYVKHKNLASPEGRAVYKRNFQLMQLLRVDPPKKEEVKLDLGKFNKEAFASVCEELSFVSILRNLDEFTGHFA